MTSPLFHLVKGILLSFRIYSSHRIFHHICLETKLASINRCVLDAVVGGESDYDDSVNVV